MPMTNVALLEKTCGIESMNLGKPNPHMIRMAMNHLINVKKLIHF